MYRSAQSQRTVSSTASAGSGGLSRIPIKRNSSMRRKREIMENYVATSPVKTGHTSRAKMSSSSSSSANQQQPRHHDAAAGDTWSRPTLISRRRANNNRAVAAVKAAKATKSLERRGNRRRENANANNVSHSRSIGALNSLGATGAARGEGADDPFGRSKLVRNSNKIDRRNKKVEAGEQEVPKQTDNAQQKQQEWVEETQQPLAQVRSSPQSAPPAGVGAKSKVTANQHSDSGGSGGGEYHNSEDMTVESISRLSTANSTVSTLSYQVRRGEDSVAG